MLAECIWQLLLKRLGGAHHAQARRRRVVSDYPPPDAKRPSELGRPIANALFPTHASAVHYLRKEGKIRTPTGRRKKLLILSCAKSDGTLTGSCIHCGGVQEMLRFAPVESHKSNRDRAKFLAAYVSYQVAYRAGDRDAAIAQRAIVDRLRTTNCTNCSTSGHLTLAQKECKAWWDARRQRAAREHGGCQNPQCLERGDEAWCAITGDHGTNPKKKKWNKKTGKWVPVPLSDYKFWPGNGGVAAMEEEEKQIKQWICHCCHRLEPTSATGNRIPNPETLPPGKRRGTDEDVKQYNRLRRARIRHPKQQYVDELKRKIGCCAWCRRLVLPGTEQSFDFDHLEEITKCVRRKVDGVLKDALFRGTGGVAGLATNHSNASVLDAIDDETRFTVRQLIDREVAKCQLLCANCHARKSYDYPHRTPVA